MKIRKAIIPCGGMGTRFLPVTKAVPKEILPIIDTPVLKYITDEIVDSGIEEILIIIGEGKEAIREFFTEKPKLEKALKNKPHLLELVRDINKKADIKFAVQREPKGSGDAVLQAKEFTGDEPFCMSNGDDLIVASVPVTRQLADSYEKIPGVIMGVQKIAESETDKYGIVVPKSVDGRVVWCDGMIEKPKSNPPSLFAALGRYVLTPEIYDYIERCEEVGGEIRLSDAICEMMKDGKAYAYEFEGKRYDMGDKFGALTATVDFALQNPEFKDKFAAYIKAAAAKCE
ncbi:MAG: UTP--glucose-1-phosphate uridylyltransferase [Clostridiales bacterium]|nr:UTP--glucose-1-phosphate uridylyltransferase [Clostridiales bacterium]